MQPLSRYWAGLFDADGCVQPQDAGGGIRVEISNTYKPVVFTAQELFGGWVTSRMGKGPKRNSFCWRASGDTARDFLRRVQPYLVIKGEQAAMALELPWTEPGSRQRARLVRQIHDQKWKEWPI